MAGFFDGITGLNLLNGVSGFFAAKETEKTKRFESEAKTRELQQQVRIDNAKTKERAALIASSSARKAVNNVEFFKLAQWMTMAFAGSLVLLSFGKAFKKGR